MMSLSSSNAPGPRLLRPVRRRLPVALGPVALGPVALALACTLAACSSGSPGGAGVALPAGASPSSSAAAAPAAAAKPSLTVTLKVTSPEGARAVALTADVRGNVPQVLTSDGTPIPASDTEVMGSTINWGDGATDGSDPGDVMCPTKVGVLVPLAQTMPLTHTYAKAGTYTVLYTAGACKPLVEVSKTLTVTVR